MGISLISISMLQKGILVIIPKGICETKKIGFDGGKTGIAEFIEPFDPMKLMGLYENHLFSRFCDFVMPNF